MDLTGLLGGIQQPQTLSDLANDPRLAGVMKFMNEWKTAVRPNELAGYTPIPEGYVGTAYKYGDKETSWRDVPFAQRMATNRYPSLTPFEGDVPYYSKFIDNRDDDGFMGGALSVFTGGVSDMIQGNPAFSGASQELVHQLGPETGGALSHWLLPLSTTTSQLDRAFSEGDWGMGIDAILDSPQFGSVDYITRQNVAPMIPDSIKPYATTLGTTIGSIWGPIGAAAGYGIGSKIQGQDYLQGMIGSALALGTSYAGQALGSALGGLTNFSGIDSIPVDAWGAGMSTPGYATAAQIPGLLTGSFGTADELGLQNIDVGLDTPSFTKTTDFLKTYGSDLLKAGLKIASTGEVTPMPNFNFDTNQMFSPNYMTTGNVWETPMTPEEQLKAMAEAQAKKKSLTDDEPKKDTRFAYLKDWVANVPARPEFLSDYLA